MNGSSSGYDRRTVLKTTGALAATVASGGIAAAGGEDCSSAGTETYEGTLDGSGDSATHTFSVASKNVCKVVLSLSGDSGTDYDLYATLDGRTPSPYDYDKRSFSYGSDEEITIEGDEADGLSEVGILVDVYSGSGGYTLDVEEYGDGNRKGGGGGGEGGNSRLRLTVPGLEPLQQGHYEGWAIFGDEKVSTGTFTAFDTLTFDVDRDLTKADKIVVTIEPSGDSDPGPSGIVYLAGEVKSNGTADLSFPVDFSKASGEYILATPTDGANSNEKSGVWFLNPSGGPSAGLDVPDLPSGWTYEGWTVVDGTPVSTGRFDDPTKADDFAGHSGSMGGPPFPGEDLLNRAPAGLEFPVDLTQTTSKVVLTVEPDLNGTDPTGRKPFHVKPLVSKVPGDLSDHTPESMNRKLSTVPEGRAVITKQDGGDGGDDSTGTLTYDFDGIEPLERGRYEGWAIFGDEKVSTGKFTRYDSHQFEIDRDVTEADKIVVTIEPGVDSNPDPSGVVYLEGDVPEDAAKGDTVDLSFPVELDPQEGASTSGTFILGTPTNGQESDETSGVWFIDPRGGLSAGLDLPDLPSGWTYEGWTVVDGTPLTTGRFDDPTKADDFAGYSGSQGGPAFPGEDYLNGAPAGLEFPADLTNGDSKVVVTVEPDIEGSDPTGDGPFHVKVLAGDIEHRLDDHTPVEMSAKKAQEYPNGSVPSAQVTLGDVSDGCPVYCDDDGGLFSQLWDLFG